MKKSKKMVFVAVATSLLFALLITATLMIYNEIQKQKEEDALKQAAERVLAEIEEEQRQYELVLKREAESLREMLSDYGVVGTKVEIKPDEYEYSFDVWITANNINPYLAYGAIAIVADEFNLATVLRLNRLYVVSGTRTKSVGFNRLRSATTEVWGKPHLEKVMLLNNIFH